MINTVHYADFVSYSAGYMRDVHEMRDPELWCKEHPEHYAEWKDRFCREMPTIIAPGGMFIFIVTNEQLPYFLKDAEDLGITKYLAHKPPVAVNCNYPEMGFRLNMFIYNIPKKDDHV